MLVQLHDITLGQVIILGQLTQPDDPNCYSINIEFSAMVVLFIFGLLLLVFFLASEIK